jgi:hypothetical protein
MWCRTDKRTNRVNHSTKTRQSMYVEHNIEARLSNHFCSGKAIRISYSCVCVWGGGCTGTGVSLRAYSFNYPTCSTPPYCHSASTFFDILINGPIFRRMLLDIKCVFWFSLRHVFGTFLMLRRVRRDAAINVQRVDATYWLFWTDFNQPSVFSTHFRKKLKYKVVSKFVQWEPSCSTRTDRRTWRS